MSLPSVTTRRAGAANVCAGLQPRTRHARLDSLETPSAHASSPVKPQRAQPFRAAALSVNVASSAPIPWQTREDAASPCVLEGRRHGRPCRIQRTSSFRMSVFVDRGFSCKHDARALQHHGLSASCRNTDTACPWGWSALLFTSAARQRLATIGQKLRMTTRQPIGSRRRFSTLIPHPWQDAGIAHAPLAWAAWVLRLRTALLLEHVHAGSLRRARPSQ